MSNFNCTLTCLENPNTSCFLGQREQWINENNDRFIWLLNKNGTFFVKSVYTYLINNSSKVTQKVWCMKVTLEKKLCFLKKRVILTNGSIAGRNWNSSKTRSFCSKYERIQHLFFECPCAQFLWHAMYYVFGIKPRRHTLHLFNHWSKLGGAKHNQVIDRTVPMCWAIHRLIITWCLIKYNAP